MAVHRSWLAKLALMLGCVPALSMGFAIAQQSSTATETTPAYQASGAGNVSNGATAQPSGSPKSWLVRDPWTGRIFQQQLVSTNVPVTKWEPKTIDQTVYEPRIATAIQNIPQTIFVPVTQYVMQPKLRGWWNPWKQPVQAYEYKPVTSWVPQTQQQQRAYPTQQWIAKQQKVVVYQPVQSTEVRQQLVQTELPQPQATQYAANLRGIAPYAPSLYQTTNRIPGQPLIQFPLLAQKRGVPAPPWPGTVTQPVANASLANNQWNTTPSAPVLPAATTYNPMLANQSQPPMQPTRMVLPPAMSNVLPSGYRAPLRSSSSNIASRDTVQAGMQATELR